MRILYAAAKHDYGFPERGLSFEHYNFYEFFRRSGHDLVYFDSVGSYKEYGRDASDRRLLELVGTTRPDLFFSVLFTDELNPQVVREISEQTDTLTLNWFCDDHWRFETFSRHWAPNYNWVVTTAKSAVQKYERVGYECAIKSQWACNHFLYRKLDVPLRYDVSFVGQPHGDRRVLIEALRDSGVEVHTFGLGWGAGRVSQDEMIRIFNQSRINLNLSNASTLEAEAGPSTWFSRLLRGTASARKKMGYVQQIKARNFEVPGCGGFLLTEYAEDLESYYELGKEVVCFDGVRDLADKIAYYLKHEDERAAIARAGYERTMRDHTYTHRFAEIFAKLSLRRA